MYKGRTNLLLIHSVRICSRIQQVHSTSVLFFIQFSCSVYNITSIHRNVAAAKEKEGEGGARGLLLRNTPNIQKALSKLPE